LIVPLDADFQRAMRHRRPVGMKAGRGRKDARKAVTGLAYYGEVTVQDAIGDDQALLQPAIEDQHSKEKT
jgi:hypothetical protein